MKLRLPFKRLVNYGLKYKLILMQINSYPGLPDSNLERCPLN